MKKLILILCLFTGIVKGQIVGGALTNKTGWTLKGNALGNNTSFLGSTDNRSLSFKTNNVTRAKLDSLGIFKIWGDSINFNSTFVVDGGRTVNGSNPDVLLKSYYDGRVIFHNTTTTKKWTIRNNTSAGSSLDWFMIGQSTGGNAFAITSATNVVIANALKVGSSTSVAPTATLQVVGTVNSSGNVSLPHIIGNSTAPTIASGSGLGTGAGTVVSLTRATDLSGIIGVVTGTASLGTTANLAVITFNSAYGVAPNVLLTPANQAAADLIIGTNIHVPASSVGTTSFAPVTNTVALTASATYSFWYHVLQ